ncbi:MAG: hypothetical protein HY870_21755 [Chloroflexi bacterium]|nr:hypothetical protein [Chloroflexota bacterium]
MSAFTAAGVFARPAQQATVTPVATVAATQVVTPTETLVPTAVSTATSVAPAVSPLATPGTLPQTGASDEGTAALSLLVAVVGALLLLGAFGLALSRRPR